MRFARARPAVAALLLLGVAACTTTPRPKAALSAPPPAGTVPPAGGVKIGKPYVVFGKTYVPADDRSYDERGIASWYGPTFHAKPTATGEIYNQDDVTAAHKTLPMPSWVEVTNLDNGRQLVVRVNDRGPFVDGRIIDLSRRSAQLLGVEQAGLARVRVRRVFPPGDWALAGPQVPIKLAAPAVPTKPAPAAAGVVRLAAAAPAAPPEPAGVALPETVRLTAVPAPQAGRMPQTAAAPETGPVPQAAPVPEAPAGRFIQVAALADEGRAKALASALADFGPAEARLSPAGLWRVRIGPLAPAAAGSVLGDVQAAGYADARLMP